VFRITQAAAFLIPVLALGCSSADDHGHPAAAPPEPASAVTDAQDAHAAHGPAADDASHAAHGHEHGEGAGAAAGSASVAHDHGAAGALRAAAGAAPRDPAARDAADTHAGHAAPAARATPAAQAAPAAHAAHEAHAAHDAHAHHGVDLPATAGQGYTVADVRFMQMMMGHHAQAVVMSRMARTHGASDMLLRLAEKIDISQRDEIEMMRLWLLERGQVSPTDEQMLAMFMPGMLTPEQMQRLDAVRGREFERLFLVLMIQHHDGALDMVDELFAAPGAAQDPDIFRFATDVAADQGDEIFIMQRMLDTLAATGGSQLQ
jgi:uncharacterized protein (DUF305 family)